MNYTTDDGSPARVGARPFAVLAILHLIAALAQAQSDPATFTDVFNIGTVPPGSPLDVPGAVTGASVGGASNTTLMPLDLTGDILGDGSQLNLFDGGTITGLFDVLPRSTAGDPSLLPPQNVGLRAELNILGGVTGDLVINANARANINGGSIASLEVLAGSDVTINGGDIGGAGPFGLVASNSAELVINGGTFTGGFAGDLNTAITINGGTLIPAGNNLFFALGDLTVTGGSIGNGFASSGTLNVTGGSFGSDFSVSAATANISDATFGSGFFASSDSVVEISGDTTFGDNFVSRGDVIINGGVFGSNVSTDDTAVSGGVFGERFVALGDVTLTGAEFQRNGVATADLSAGLLPGSGDLVTGVLADGNVFIFADDARDEFSPGATAQVVAVAPSTNPGVLSAGVFGQGVRPGETLTVEGAGQLANDFAVVGGTLNLNGGTAGVGLEAAFSEINIAGGTVAGGFRAFNGTTVNFSAGAIGFGVAAFAGSTFNLSGGSVLTGFSASAGSEVNVETGGAIGDGSGSFGVVNVNGGSIGNDFTAFSGSTVTITDGAIGADFTVLGFATANIQGGDIGDLSAAAFSTINFSGGTVSGSFGLTGQADISGGTFNGAFNVSNDPTIPSTTGITGVANISGGTFNDTIIASGVGTLNVSGGSFNGDFLFLNGGVLNLFGSEFFLDGVELTELVVGEAFTILDRNVALTGMLADGSPFAFDLNDVFTIGGDTFLGSTVAVTLIPEPSSLLLMTVCGLSLLGRRRDV